LLILCHETSDSRKSRPARKRPAFGGVLIAFLAAAYLVVGFVGEISCAEESLITSTQVSASAAAKQIR